MDVVSVVDRTAADADDAWHLAHVMLTSGMGSDGSFQVGYYDPGSDKVINFSVSKDAVVREKASEAFKDSPTIKELSLDSVKVSLDEALALSDKVMSEKFSEHPVNKRIVLLQHLDEGQVYNVTNITRTLTVVNLRFDAASGELVREHAESVFSFREE